MQNENILPFITKNYRGGVKMFQKTDFWIGLAGIFGYRFMQEREQQMAALQQAAPATELPVAELQRQKEELEDLIAAQEAKKN